ncbi:MAG: lipid-A-disaccharide synthase [Pseudomonadota bacterium]
MARPLRIALVAGETSGDALGAALIDALRTLAPDTQFMGMAGPRMRAAGCVVLADSSLLGVMGFAEVVPHLWRLWRLRASLLRQLLRDPPDVFVGIDSSAFNLGLARKLKDAGIATVQYVSPQIWASRRWRVRGIAAAVDKVLCLLPFEVPFYADHAVEALFIGHPLADQMPLTPDRAEARAALNLPGDARVVALLPGSRLGEVQRLGDDFAAAAALLQSGNNPHALLCIAPMATAVVRAVFEQQVVRAGAAVRLLDGQSRVALAAADAVLVASGTATLESLLSKRPMVVAYRLSAATAFLVRELGLVKVRHFALPNLLAGTDLVPEFFQDAVTPQALADAVRRQLQDDASRQHLVARFHSIHQELRRNGAALAAQAVLELAQRRRTRST